MLSGESAMGNFPRKQSRCWRRSPRSPKHIGRRGALRLNANSCSGRQRLLAAIAWLLWSSTHLYTVPCDLVLVPTRGGNIARAISRFKPPVWIIAPSSDCAACQNLAFSYGVYPINLAEEPDDWREWIAGWLRENGMTAEQVMLVPAHLRETRKPIIGSSLCAWTRRMGERQRALK
jgi:Pyruvate kinase